MHYELEQMEVVMKKQISVALAAALLLGGVSAASAVTQPQSNALPIPAATHGQRQMAWNDLHSQAREQKGPANFREKAGALLPSTVSIKPVTSKVASAIPALKSYDFAMLNGKLVIVNPADSRVAEVITG
jgi:hypothetical protein